MIKSIKATNFLSWEELDFNIEEGVTLITGHNYDDDTPEGSGKSAILNALSWGIYGKLPKDTNIDDVIRTGQKSCGVSIEIGDYLIVRLRKPNALYFVKDGKSHQGKDMRETQKLIEEIVGMSFETFCTVIYFPQDNNKKFITATQEEKGKVLSEIQNLDLFEKARREAHELLKIEKSNLIGFERQLNEIQLKLSHCEQSITMAEQYKAHAKAESIKIKNSLQYKLININEQMEINAEIIENNEEIIDNFDENKSNKNKSVIEDFINNMEIDKSTVRSQLYSIDQQQNLVNTYKRDLKLYKSKSESLKKKIKDLVEFIENPSKSCPTCGTLLGTHDTSHTKTELQNLDAELTDLNNQESELEALIETTIIPDATEINDFIKNIDVMIRAKKAELEVIANDKLLVFKAKTIIDEKVKTIQALLNEQHILETEVLDCTNVDLSKFDAQIAEQSQIMSKHLEVKYQIEELKLNTEQYIARLETLRASYKEIKSYVFNAVLNELMIKSNKYIQELFEVPARIVFTNDDLKIGTEVILDGNSRSFGLLSGGQAKRVSLAVDLALSDISLARGGSKLNLVIFDEPFQNLSEASMIKCIKLLTSLNKPTLIVEHNSIAQSAIDRVFEIEYREGVSKSVK